MSLLTSTALVVFIVLFIVLLKTGISQMFLLANASLTPPAGHGKNKRSKGPNRGGGTSRNVQQERTREHQHAEHHKKQNPR